MDGRYDVIIIGSGCGGAASAALAGYRGLKTLLIEKNKILGGRAATHEVNGFKMDHGHIIGRCDQGPHGDLLRMVECGDLIPRYHTVVNLRPTFHMFGQRWDLSHGMMKGAMFDALPKILLSPYFSLNDLQGIGMIGNWMMSQPESEIRKLDYIDLKTFLSRYSESKLVHYIMGAISAVSFGVLPDDVSAGEFIRTIQGVLDVPESFFGYPVNGEGVSAIPNSFLRAAERYGADIEVKTAAEKVVIDGGRVRGVCVNGGLVESDMVISNIGIKETTHKLAGREHFEKSFIDYLDGLKYSYGGISLKFALDEPIVGFDVALVVPADFDRNMHDALEGRIPDANSIMAVCTSNMDPSLAPPGKQILVAIAPGPPVEPGTMDWTPWVESLKRQIEAKLAPGLSRHTLFCVDSTPDVIAKENGRFLGDAIGVAQSMDQIGDNAPPFFSPVKGLYHVGADVGTKGIATEMATQSAIDLFEKLDEERPR